MPNLPQQSQFLIYQTEDGRVKIDVRFEDESVWLTQQMMADLFQTSKQNVSHHIKSIFDEGELSPEATVKKYLTVVIPAVKLCLYVALLFRGELFHCMFSSMCIVDMSL